MKLKLQLIKDYSFIPLPVIVRWEDESVPNPSARGLVIKMPVGYNKNSTEWFHEQFHVVQFYAFFAIIMFSSVAPFAVAEVIIRIQPSLAFIASTCALLLSIAASFYIARWYGSGEASLGRECAAYGESLRRSPKKDVNWRLDFYTEALAKDPLYFDIQEAMGGTVNSRCKLIKPRIEEAFLKGYLFG